MDFSSSSAVGETESVKVSGHMKVKVDAGEGSLYGHGLLQARNCRPGAVVHDVSVGVTART
jgi:hypothetical protein